MLGPLQRLGEVRLLLEAELRRLLPRLPVEAGRVAQLVADLGEVEAVDVGLARAYSAQEKLKDALAAAKKALAQAPDDVNRKGLQAMIEKLSAGKPID